MGALKTVLIILAFILVIFVAALIIGYFTALEPFHSLYLTVTGYVEPAKQTLTDVMSDPLAAGGTVATAIGGIGGAVVLGQQLSAAKTKITTEAANAKSQIDSLTAQASDLKSQFTTEKDQLTSQFNNQITELNASKEALQKEATDAKTQLSTVQANFKEIEAQKAAAQLKAQDLQKQLDAAIAKLSMVPTVK